MPHRPLSKKTKKALVLALVTAPDSKTARKLAQAGLKARLVACANLVQDIESHYWWQDKLEQAVEVLIIFKTATAHVRALEELVLGLHPYETPEFIVVPLTAGNRKYLDWIRQSTAKTTKA